MQFILNGVIGVNGVKWDLIELVYKYSGWEEGFVYYV
jgi:hypothetical protein